MDYTFDVRVAETPISHYLLSLSSSPSVLIKRYDHNVLTGEQKLIAEMPHGVHKIPYKEKELTIKINESDEVFSSASRPIKYYNMTVTFREETRTEAEKFMQGLYIDAIEFSKSKDQTYVSVYTYSPQSGWSLLSKLVPRPLDTIYMDVGEKTKLISDIKSFLQEEEEYIKFGIPYKRCYLFQGIPGSGKSSLIFAIASMLKRDICTFNFSSDMIDEDFVRAVSCVESSRILVLEDIDSTFEKKEDTPISGISFSCLLNTLDGLCRKNKLMIFLTTNKMDNLDKTLIRPGRIDYVLLFSYAQKKQMEQMFNKFLPDQSSNFEAFYSSIHSFGVNISLLQKFLFEHRKSANILEHKKELIKLINQYEEKSAQLYT